MLTRSGTPYLISISRAKKICVQRHYLENVAELRLDLLGARKNVGAKSFPSWNVAVCDIRAAVLQKAPETRMLNEHKCLKRDQKPEYEDEKQLPRLV